MSLVTAFSYEDVAYATYVKEYNSGKFGEARNSAEIALEFMRKLLPNFRLGCTK